MRKLLALTGMTLMLAGVGHAQGAVKLEWPRSFTGQPDFAFTRDEALAEARARAARSGDAAPQLPTILTLSADDTVPDPLRLRTEQQAGDGTLRVNEEAEASPFVTALDTNSLLPVYASPSTPDLTEFQNTLTGVVSATLAGWQPNPAQFDLSQVVNTLVLQAVVTSPNRYAVINGERYTEGSSFLMRVPVTIPDSEVIRALDAEMPVLGTFDATTEDAYRAAYEAALAAYAAARNANPALGQQAMNLPVVVKAIESRKVVVEVSGRPYDLGMRYRY